MQPDLSTGRAPLPSKLKKAVLTVTASAAVEGGLWFCQEGITKDRGGAD